jgi:hypothetical protein
MNNGVTRNFFAAVWVEGGYTVRFFFGGVFNKLNLRIEGRENGDLVAVAP